MDKYSTERIADRVSKLEETVAKHGVEVVEISKMRINIHDLRDSVNSSIGKLWSFAQSTENKTNRSLEKHDETKEVIEKLTQVLDKLSETLCNFDTKISNFKIKVFTTVSVSLCFFLLIAWLITTGLTAFGVK